MIRRTLALAGAAALAVGFTGLAGPAAADSGAGTTQAGSLVISEVSAHLNTTFNGGDIVGGHIELFNDTEGDINVGGFLVTGCTTSDSFEIMIPTGTVIPAQERYLVGDVEYAAESGPDANQQFASGEVLEQIAGGALLESNSSPRQTVDQVLWGDDNPQVACAVTTNAGVLPTSTESMNRGASGWSSGFLAAPTPQRLN